jgi:hypothetical protein
LPPGTRADALGEALGDAVPFVRLSVLSVGRVAGAAAGAAAGAPAGAGAAVAVGVGDGVAVTEGVGVGTGSGGSAGASTESLPSRSMVGSPGAAFTVQSKAIPLFTST